MIKDNYLVIWLSLLFVPYSLSSNADTGTGLEHKLSTAKVITIYRIYLIYVIKESNCFVLYMYISCVHFLVFFNLLKYIMNKVDVKAHPTNALLRLNYIHFNLIELTEQPITIRYSKHTSRTVKLYLRN